MNQSSFRSAGQIINLIHWPISKLLGVIVAFGALLFSPKEWVDFLLDNPRVPTLLNPWLGLIFVLASSFFVTYFMVRFLSKIRSWCKKKEVFADVDAQ
ncbi:MAG: superinfection exclusion B family protein [Acidobacteriia bacterium]|nr:superinfection exclusion B family protein [Terriglobia bacterium]